MKLRRGLAGLGVCVLLLGTGCFGNFAMTRATHQFNRNVTPNKWGQWAVFLGLNVIPVYETTMLLDAVVVNSAQFWSGHNAFEANAPGQPSGAGAPAEAAAEKRQPSGTDGTAHSPQAP